MKQEDEPEKPGFFQVVFSVLAAGFGVQSSQNRERDFKHGSFKVYVVVGLIGVVLFVSILVAVVSIVVRQ